MVSKKKPGQKRVRTLLFPPEVPETRNSPLAELFWGEIFLKTPWDPSGTLLGGSQMVSKKKSPKKGPNIDVSTKPQIWGKLPLAGNFLQGNFFSTPWDPSGTLLEGSQMVSRKIPIKKSGLTAVFPYRNPLKPKNAPGGKKNVGKNFFNTWGVLTYPQRNFSDGEQKETSQKNQ